MAARSRVMPEDMLDTVIRGDFLRRQSLGQPPHRGYPRWKRRWVEPGFNLIGWCVGQILRMFPWPLRWRADQRIVRWMGARLSAEHPRFSEFGRDFAATAQQLHQKTGRWPAALVFVSHAPTVGESEWLRFELEREGLMLANALMETTHPGHLFRPTPECFLAIDPFALDTVPTPVAALYAGFMHRIYLVWDRQSRTQSLLQRHLLLRGTGYDRIAFRLLARLKRGIPIVMVLPGGLPQNARLLYAAKEFVAALPVPRWPYSKREAQKKWLDLLVQPVDGKQAFETGILPTVTRTALLALLQEWGFSEPEQTRWMEEFAREFKLDVPYRTRLFRVLLGRLAAKGTPLLWIGLAHGPAAPTVHVSAAWGAYRDPKGNLQLVRGPGAPAEPISDIRQLTMDFAQQFLV